MSYSAVHDAHVEKNRGYGSNSVYVGSNLGEIEIVVCTTCGYEDVFCTHLRSKRNPEGALLICVLCGNDGT